MKRMTVVAGILMAFLLGGCAAMEQANRRNEARQLAWTGPGAGPCAFGGVTPEADAHCGLVTSGPEGVLLAINGRVSRKLGPGADPGARIEAASRLLARHEDLRTERLYTCPRGAVDAAACRAVLLVTAADGERYVLDSGAVLGEQVAPDGVASFMAFELFVNGDYAVGAPPVRTLAGGRPDAAAPAAR